MVIIVVITAPVISICILRSMPVDCPILPIRHLILISLGEIVGFRCGLSELFRILGYYAA